ncbi:glycosyltransferase family 4 protein [Dictyobacter kobayashii]|uniref:Glycosyl transferase n=1 Tax=Dictyobacter kobayashii TaxID=2014872 RepID=A0A402AC70_9CHLR|nr:glycosyltransferase family 4 protein [Dictyobacter kobayashii]GCE16702.1 glycosyl transferase [Dictyobacter kobayashii]
MKIGIIAPPFEKVPPPKYGGAERVISTITEGMCSRGHDVVLFSVKDSQTKAQLRYIYEHPLRTFNMFSDDAQANFAFQSASEFDIIHDHTYTGAGVRYAQIVDVPTIATIHNIPNDAVEANDQTIKIYSSYKKAFLVSVSNTQQTLFPGVNFFSTVYNGVDTHEFQYHAHKDDFMLHIGAISRRKGSHIAVEVARRTRYPLKLAGKIDDHEKPFFDEYIAPYLKPGFIEYVGEVGGQERVELFQRARFLLFPVQWPEPFGLVMIEAMACGTPVIAFGNGAVPEVIKHRKTGFVVFDIDEMCLAINDINSLSSRDCREHVLKNFSNEIMLQRYESIFHEILQKRK